jgi:hypothetical protein
MIRLSDLNTEVLLIEYQQSVKRLKSLDPRVPEVVRDIRTQYRDYIGEELAKRGLLKSGRELRAKTG